MAHKSPSFERSHIDARLLIVLELLQKASLSSLE